MKMLSFDTSSDRLSAALFQADKRLAFYESDAPIRHSETLAPILEKVIRKAGLRPQEIKCVAVGLGPGSFTGLRIAVTTAKVLAYSLKANLVGISSLEAIARTGDRDGDFAVLVDAKKFQVYAAIYRKKNKEWKTLQNPAIILRDDFLKSLKRGMVVLEDVSPSAVRVAEGVLERIRRKQFDDPFSLEPLYLHPKDCNVSPSAKK